MRTLSFIASAFAAALALAATAGAFAAGSGHGDRNGRIAVTHRSFSIDCCVITTDVLTMNPDGSDPRQATSTAAGGESGAPAWADEGNRIYFDSDQAGNVHVFSTNANGHGVKQITSGNGFEFTPSPSPNGKSIAFDGYFPDAAPDGAQGIYLTGRHGGSFADFRRLTFAADGGFDTDPDVSPDSTKVAFRRVLSDFGPNAQSAVFVIGIDGSGLRQLTPYSLDATYPRWSPDGRRLVFSSNLESNFDQQDIWVVNADGGGLTQLTNGGVGNPSFEPDWSPDGRKIVFAHFLPTGFFTQLRVMNADGSDVHVIWQGADHSIDRRPDWGTRD